MLKLFVAKEKFKAFRFKAFLKGRKERNLIDLMLSPHLAPKYFFEDWN